MIWDVKVAVMLYKRKQRRLWRKKQKNESSGKRDTQDWFLWWHSAAVFKLCHPSVIGEVGESDEILNKLQYLQQVLLYPVTGAANAKRTREK